MNLKHHNELYPGSRWALPNYESGTVFYLNHGYLPANSMVGDKIKLGTKSYRSKTLTKKFVKVDPLKKFLGTKKYY